HCGTLLYGPLTPNHRINGDVRRRPASARPRTPLVGPDWEDDPDQVLAALTGHDASAVDAEPVDAVIAAIGGWFIDRPLLDRGLDKFDEDFDSYLRGHFTACTISQRLSESRSRAAAVTGNVAHLALNGVASRQALPGS